MKDIGLGELRRTRSPEPGMEIVERKGAGHPDTICDALAENLSRTLSRHYLDHFGTILHHNVDKVLLAGGASRPRFGGGEILEPIEIFLVGRATREFQGVPIPVEELAVGSVRDWFRRNLPRIEGPKHLKVHFHLRPGSSDLTGLFGRPGAKVPLANDTSIGVGFAPLTPLEKAVLGVERELNSPDFKGRFPEYGSDIKVMGTQLGETLSLTVPCAFVDRFVADRGDYQEKKNKLVGIIRDVARARASLDPEVGVNTADGEDPSSLFLTVTGTSAEAGDDGQVGRGNRANGLITPFRPMTLEASAGKNPVSHTGKLYQAVAQSIAEKLVALEGVEEAECYLVSRIGRPINDPQAADVRLGLAHGRRLGDIKGSVEQVVGEETAGVGSLWKKFLDGSLVVF